MIGGFARLDNRTVMVIGTQKGRDTKSNLYRNFSPRSTLIHHCFLQQVKLECLPLFHNFYRTSYKQATLIPCNASCRKFSSRSTLILHCYLQQVKLECLPLYHNFYRTSYKQAIQAHQYIHPLIQETSAGKEPHLNIALRSENHLVDDNSPDGTAVVVKELK